MTDIIVSDAQKSAPEGNFIELFEIELGDSSLYFYQGTGGGSVRFRDRKDPNVIRDYIPFPVEMEGLDLTSDGPQNRPTFRVANVLSALKIALGDLSYQDLLGKRLIRRRTLDTYLVGESGDTNPPQEWPIKVFVIARISAENNQVVEFELSSVLDLANVRIPNRPILSNLCPWIYRGVAEGRGGGCYWKNEIRDADGKTFRVYITEDGNLVIQNINGLIQIPTYSATATYHWNSWVKVYQSNGSIKYYKAAVRTTFTSQIPGESSNWEEVFLYDTYRSSLPVRTGQYILYNNILYRYIGPNSNTAPEPSTPSQNYIRADICSKTLDGCKRRFQVKLTEVLPGTWLPNGERNTLIPLPFGGFPTSDKYR